MIAVFDEPPFYRWFFGEPWGAPALDDLERGATPVGSLCAHCRIGIAEGDQGYVMPCVSTDGVWPIPYHLDCLLTSVGAKPCDHSH